MKKICQKKLFKRGNSSVLIMPAKLAKTLTEFFDIYQLEDGSILLKNAPN